MKVLKLRLDGLRQTEIAEQLNMTPGQVAYVSAEIKNCRFPVHVKFRANALITVSVYAQLKKLQILVCGNECTVFPDNVFPITRDEVELIIRALSQYQKVAESGFIHKTRNDQTGQNF